MSESKIKGDEKFDLFDFNQKDKEKKTLAGAIFDETRCPKFLRRKQIFCWDWFFCKLSKKQELAILANKSGKQNEQ